MDKEELEQKISSMEKELVDLKNELKTQDKIWKPKEGEKYWTLTEDGMVDDTTYYAWCEDCVKFCNYFKTKEEAEKQAEYNKAMNRFRKYVEAYSEPLDWDINKEKYYTYYNNETCKIAFAFITTKPDAFEIYASSEQILKDAIIYSAGSEEEFIRIVFNGGK